VTPAEYASHDATGLAALVRSKAMSADEILDAAVERIAALNPALNAVVHLFVDQGRAAIRQGLPAGPFEGVPYLIKNTGLAVAGTPLTTGSALFRDAISPADGTLTQRMRQAGLVIIGKTNVPEMAMSFTTEPKAFGATRNPWNLAHGPGGSSGGAAAAVASGMLPMAHASDGGGSTRLPAAHCGLFGMKPSRMRLPFGPVAAEGIAGMSGPHCLSWSVRDCAAMLDASHGADIGDPYAAPPVTGTFLAAVTRAPGALRVGFTTVSPLGTPVEPACAAATAAAASLCESLGHHVEHAAPDYDAMKLKWAWRVISAANACMQVTARAAALGISDWRGLVEPVNAEWADEGSRLSAATYAEAIAALHATSRAMGAFFSRYDIYLSPTTGETAPKLGVLADRGDGLDAFYDRFWQHGPFTAVFNASGCPAMSVPFGLSPAGLPVGVQMGAAFGAEATLFSLAGQIEMAQPWFHIRPPALG
jgi:amidase